MVKLKLSLLRFFHGTILHNEKGLFEFGRFDAFLLNRWPLPIGLSFAF